MAILASRLVSAVPNALSLCRLGLAIAYPWLPRDWRLEAVLAAALSDILDGSLSRWLRVTGATGRILDPLADKAFVLGIMATFLSEGTLQIWEVVLVGLRDIVVLLGIVWIVARKRRTLLRRMPPSLLGKATTMAQFLFLLAVLIYDHQVLAVFVPTVVLSGLTAVDYIRRSWAANDDLKGDHSE